MYAPTLLAQLILIATPQAGENETASPHPLPPIYVHEGGKYAPSNGARVVNGEPAKKGEIPWQAALFIKGPKPNQGWLCGGSVVRSGWILTAAHCAVLAHTPSDITVLTGSNDLNDSAMKAAIATKIFLTDPPNKFEPKTWNNDIALVVADTASDAKAVNIVNGENESALLQAEALVVSGYGTISEGGRTSDQLLRAEVRFVSNADCNAKQSYDGKIPMATMLCAGPIPNKPPTDSCQGDSGGPIFVAQTPANKATQVGIVSWGDGCAQKDFPGVYTRLSHFEQWVNHVINTARR